METRVKVENNPTNGLAKLENVFAETPWDEIESDVSGGGKNKKPMGLASFRWILCARVTTS